MAIKVTQKFNSSHKFIDPPRYFKENDPYWWQMDNIPLKQIQENCLWLKDAVTKSIFEVDDITRKTFGELKPYFVGQDRVLRVQPGRYISRINDAYSENPLNNLKFSSKGLKAKVSNSDPATLNSLVNSIAKHEVSINSNGFYDRKLSHWRFADDRTPLATVLNTNKGPLQNGDLTNSWPGLTVGWFTKKQNAIIDAFENNGGDFLAGGVSLVKQWGAVARTAVVDIPEELSIEVPEFTDNDYFYINSAGQKIDVTSPQVRIDLVFIYSKPVDANTTRLQRFSDGNPVEIQTPVLGILKGAGLGFQDTTQSNHPVYNAQGNNFPQSYDTLGVHSMFGNARDADTSNTNGFREGPFTSQDVKGSFPSPEDLLNIAPNLILDLESTDPQLVGQTVLPICYIIVDQTATTTNAQGQVVLTDVNIIDIRPFFRTAELTYSERSGLAAANPPVGLANPVVGEVKVRELISQFIGGGGGQGNVGIEDAKVIAKGVVWGGFLFGPEGTLFDSWASQEGNLDGTDVTKVYQDPDTQLILPNFLTDVLGFADTNCNLQIPLFPAWDLATWANGLSDSGLLPNDWINFIFRNSNESEPNGFGGCPGMRSTTRAKLGLPNSSNLYPSNGARFGTYPAGDTHTMALFTRKAINITNIPNWVGDTVILAQYLNCMSQSNNGGDGQGGNPPNGNSGFAGLYVSKDAILPDTGNGDGRTQRISVNSYWNADLGEHEPIGEYTPKNQRTTWRFHGFLADAKGGKKYHGACIYPTVEFTVIGVDLQHSDPTSTKFGLPNVFTTKGFNELPLDPLNPVAGNYNLQNSNSAGVRPWVDTITSHSKIKAF